ncbi:DUF4129 domain-containing protein [Nocardioides sp. SR21]|uniref:DUF4129 domain-containing protein n=1 Tax=Nocardioides sp. SR21 TaxID=2919501 RepID=UPI001FA978BE|nr:DUF4129 domain-containing protein [Nocardioides sp. SR21]
MSARRASTTAVAAVLATALLVLVLVTWASSIGPSEVLRGDGPSPVGTPTDEPTSTEGASVPQEDADVEGSGETPTWLKVAAFAVNVAVVVLLAVLVVRYLVLPLLRRTRTRRRRRRRGRDQPAEPEFTVLEPPQRVAQALLDDAAAQRRLLEGGSPRNAVVECWHRFETAAAAAGFERRDWETSSEYTMRVLDLVDAHQPAVSRLGDLYREARFSEHDLTEADRADALEALDTIHRTIGVPA